MAVTSDDKEDYLGILDGVRGLMALWVFYGHALVDVTGKLPRFGSMAFAVDVFMFISGFLMMYHWKLREDRFASGKAQTLDFYIRRFFRIAPLYYLLYCVALVGQSYFLNARTQIPLIVPPPWAESLKQHVDPTVRTITPANIFAHLSFLFGFLPRYAANNALPDWSIALEMQFYAFLPLLLIILKRVGPLTLVIGSLLAVWVTGRLFGLYLESGPLGSFPQPTLIFFKLNVFVGGICFAFAYLHRRERRGFMWLIAAMASMYGVPLPAVMCIAVLTLLLFLDSGIAQRELLHRLLSGRRMARFFGDTSYAVYLCHELILLPVAIGLLHQDRFLSLGSNARIAITFLIVAPPLYLVAYLLHRYVERPGIDIGRHVLSPFKQNLNSSKSANESLA